MCELPRNFHHFQSLHKNETRCPEQADVLPTPRTEEHGTGDHVCAQSRNWALGPMPFIQSWTPAYRSATTCPAVPFFCRPWPQILLNAHLHKSSMEEAQLATPLVGDAPRPGTHRGTNLALPGLPALFQAPLRRCMAYGPQSDVAANVLCRATLKRPCQRRAQPCLAQRQMSRVATRAGQSTPPRAASAARPTPSSSAPGAASSSLWGAGSLAVRRLPPRGKQNGFGISPLSCFARQDAQALRPFPCKLCATNRGSEQKEFPTAPKMAYLRRHATS